MKFLVTGDWHLRSTVPSCLDYTQNEWINIQKTALNRLLEIMRDKDVHDLLFTGDLFHSEPTSSFEIIQIAQQFVIDCAKESRRCYFIQGNHDTYNHSSDLTYRSAMGVFLKSNGVHQMIKGTSDVFCGCNFDEDDYGDYPVIVKHVLTMPSNEKPDYIDCETPESLLDKYPKARFILTGDYHRYFEYHIDGRNVINPGCLTIQASDFEGYEPSVFVIDIDDNTTERIEIGIDYVFNHNGEVKKELDKSIEDFVNHIKKQDVTLDYITSLKNAASSYDEAIQKKILSWITRSGN